MKSSGQRPRVIVPFHHVKTTINRNAKIQMFQIDSEHLAVQRRHLKKLFTTVCVNLVTIIMRLPLGNFKSILHQAINFELFISSN
jgi:hypothetical protein